MRVPLSWLRELVDVELDLDEIVDVMSLHGLEVDEVRRPGAGAEGIVTARVLDHQPHPNADTLQVVHITHGSDEVELVCGAWNFQTGDVVAHAPVGARLPGGMELSARDIRGVTSNGMLCSARELEIGQDHEGIMVLPDDAPLGVDVHDLLPLGDPVIDVAVFADRGDHHSILGIARELAAILDLDLRRPEIPDLPTDPSIPIRIEATEGCSQFLGCEVQDVRIGPSPWWLRQRLEACGVRSISTVVDVTNYVMLELGQPLHAFDLATLHGPEIVVRWARDDEPLTTLDERDRQLEPTDLVVADADRAVALAGVMGGAETEVTDDTDRVLLEAATWDPATIRRTSRRLNLVSEASTRFERRVDPAIAGPALARAADLLEEVAGGRAAAATHAGDAETPRPRITLDAGHVRSFLGLDDLATDTQAELLERLGCSVDRRNGSLEVEPPTWRGDLGREADLVEEIARLHGYEAIPATLPAITLTGGLSEDQKGEQELRGICRGFGFHEAYLRPFTGPDVLQGLLPADDRVKLANPLAKDADAMRPTVIEGLLGAVRHNVGQGRQGVALFEFGRIFRPSGDPIEDALDAFGHRWRWTDPDGEPLPTQPRVVGLAAQGLRHGPDWLDTDQTWTVPDLLAVLDDLVGRLAPTGSHWRLERDQNPETAGRRPGFHPGRTAILRLDGREIGLAGQLHPKEAERRDLPEPVVIAEMLVEPLLDHLADGREPVQSRTLTRHPAMTVDVALVADESVPYERLAAAVQDGAGDLLDGLWWFDEYRGEQVGEGRRSVAIRVRLQSLERQLTDEDADAVIDTIEQAAQKVGATLRR